MDKPVNGQPATTTLGSNVMSLAALLKAMKDEYGIPWDKGLDILRIALMFATTPEDPGKAAAAVTPAEMKGFDQ